MSIREATEADLDALVAMGENFHGSTPYASELVHNPTQFRAIGERLIVDPCGVLLVRDVDGERVGMLGAMVFDHPLDGARTAGELFWFSPHEHRGVTGVRLLKAFEAWAKEQGAVRVQMIQPIWADRVGALYDALGYQTLEIAWTKRL
jgi:GNAT superfamily N-acetyltransferase